MSAYERLEELKGYLADVRRELEHLDMYKGIAETGRLIVQEMALQRLVERAEREHIKESEESESNRERLRAECRAIADADMVSRGHRRQLADRLSFLTGMGSNPTAEERAKIQRGEVSNHEVLEARHREIEAIKTELATI